MTNFYALFKFKQTGTNYICTHVCYDKEQCEIMGESHERKWTDREFVQVIEARSYKHAEEIAIKNGWISPRKIDT